MGLLSDIYSWGDTKKRDLKGLLSDPVGMLEKTVGQLQDSAKERGSLMQQAGWDFSTKSTATQEQQKFAQQTLADQGLQQVMAAMAIDPKAQKRLVDGLLNKSNTERYRLGDINPKQAADAYNMGGKPIGESLDVFASPTILEDHARKTRISQNGFTGEEVGVFAKQAMRPDSQVIPPITSSNHPLLRSQTMTDPVTGLKYNAEMPLIPVNDGFEAVSVIPQGLPARKKPR